MRWLDGFTDSMDMGLGVSPEFPASTGAGVALHGPGCPGGLRPGYRGLGSAPSTPLKGFWMYFPFWFLCSGAHGH